MNNRQIQKHEYKRSKQTKWCQTVLTVWNVWVWVERKASNLSLARVTLTFDLLTPKVEHFMPSSHGSLVLISVKIGSFFFCQNITFISLVSGRTDGRTNGQAEKIMRPLASLAWRRHHKTKNSKRCQLELNYKFSRERIGDESRFRSNATV